MTLKSMTDFVLELMESNSVENCKKIGIIKNYARFLKQPLTLGMFIPCDENGNVLKEQEEDHHFMYANGLEFYPHQKEQYYTVIQQAKEKVLFEGFNFDGYFVTLPNGQYLDYSKLPKLIIEDIVKENLTLTPNAIKQLGL